MKKLFLFLFLLVFLKDVNSQHSFLAGLDFGLSSNFNKDAPIGYGGAFEFNLGIGDRSAVRLASSYNRFNKTTAQNQDGAFFTIRTGYQYFFSNHKFFIYGDIGTANFSFYQFTENKWGPSAGVGSGSRIHTGDKSIIQFSLNYNYYRFDENYYYTWFAVRAECGLQWNKKR